MAQLFSANELLVRNETFESYHWDLLDSLYEPFDEYFETYLGFNINEAIVICETIADYIDSSFKNLLKRQIKNSI